MRALFLPALAALFIGIASPALADDDDDHRGHKRHKKEWRSERVYTDHLGRPYSGRYRHDDDWEDRRRYRDPYYEDYHHDRYRHHDDDVRIVVGGYFPYGYERVIGDYYGSRYVRYVEVEEYWGRPYRVGHRLPPGLRYRSPPPGLYDRLPPPPYGYSYVTVDRDVLLVAEASKRVIDAVVLLSGVR